MDILITGSIAYDYLMSFPGLFKEHFLEEHLEKVSLSFLVDSLVRRRGGIAPNIAYTMALLGAKPRIMATAGKDFEEYGIWLQAQGVDVSEIRTIEDKYTASFFATTDQSNAQVASFYPGAMEDAAQLSIHDLEGKAPDMVVISPNDPSAMEKYITECQELNLPYLYDPSQQIVRVDGEALQNGLKGAESLFVNEYEFEMVKKKTNLSQEEIQSDLKFMVVTLGSNGAVVYHQGGESRVDAVPTESIIDPTGVGDAFRAGFLTGYRLGMDWQICGEMGSLAATYCLENDGPQGHKFSKEDFTNRYHEHFEGTGMAEALNS